MITGGAGFIGSNLVCALNRLGRDDIIVVDEMSDGDKFRNLADCSIGDYLDKDEFLDRIESGKGLKDLEYVFHLGACSDTTEQDGRFMMKNNYAYSRSVLHFSIEKEIPFIYASSAAVYGNSDSFEEIPECEKPVNVYAYSKLQFDNYVRRILPGANSQIVGLRYFNVYGPREMHKKHMASVVLHFHEQLKSGSTVRLFKGSGGYADGEQERDFVYVDDAVEINLWFMDHPKQSGIYNVGTGKARTFNDVANLVIQNAGCGSIRYVDFPESLVGKYQSYTSASLQRLHGTGCKPVFSSLESGVSKYLAWLDRVTKT